MAEIHRLCSCHRCRRVFVGRPGERLCPDCRRDQRQNQARRLRGGFGSWQPVLTFGVASVGLGVLAGALYGPWLNLGAWVGGIAALIYIGRQ